MSWSCPFQLLIVTFSGSKIGKERRGKRRRGGGCVVGCEGGKHSLSCITWGFRLERIIRALAGKEVYWQKVKLNLLKICINGFFVILL